ncbi:hypothetical protein B296_00057446, partial [Ensete ventricosum]
MTIRIGQSQVHESGQDSDDVITNSPEVHWKLTQGIGSLLGWHKGIRYKKIETRRKIIGVAKTLAGSWEGHDVDVYRAKDWTMQREFARRFAEGIEKLTRNMSGDRRRKTVRLAAIESGGCWIAGGRWVTRPYPGFWAIELS